VAVYNGTQTSWEAVELELPALDHAPYARVRFRLDTDVSITRDGWHLDDISVRGFDAAPEGVIFRDRFESGDSSAWSTTLP
jgi:hypothetical protein